MELFNNDDKKTENSKYVEIEARVQKLFDVGPNIQPKGVWPLSSKKIHTFNEKYVLIMGDRDISSSPGSQTPRGTLMVANINTFSAEGLTTSPDFKFTNCYDFRAMSKSTDKDYIFVNLCDVGNSTSKLL